MRLLQIAEIGSPDAGPPGPKQDTLESDEKGATRTRAIRPGQPLDQAGDAPWMCAVIRLFPDLGQDAINQGLIQIDASSHKLFGQGAYLRKQSVAFGLE